MSSKNTVMSPKMEKTRCWMHSRQEPDSATAALAASKIHEMISR